VRGRFIGGHGTTLALREVLPNTLRIYQANLGHYRILDFAQAARVEVIRKPVTVAPQASPQPAVGLDGEYARSYVKPEHIFRVKLQSDDLTLLKLVKQQDFRAWEFEPSVEPIDLARETRPAYSPLYFYDQDCASFLQRGS
jgi:hypothetical protein